MGERDETRIGGEIQNGGVEEMGRETRHWRRKDEIRGKAGKGRFRRVVGDGDALWSLRGIWILEKELREVFRKKKGEGLR